MSIELKIKEAAEKSILQFISAGNWTSLNYADQVKIPKSLIDEVWQLVDTEKLKKKLKERIEEELADRIINQIATEIATDIKQVLSVPERREAIRALARQHIESLKSK